MFSSDLSPLRKGIKKEKKIRTKQEQKTISLVTHQKVRADFEWASQNTWSATTEIENLKMCYALLISLQESMKKYCGIP